MQGYICRCMHMPVDTKSRLLNNIRCAEKIMIRKIINKLNAAIHYTAMGIIGILILLVVVWVYASIKVNWAQKQVEQFGKAATIGAPITGLKKKAEELHLNYQPQSDSNDKSGKFYVWEGF